MVISLSLGASRASTPGGAIPRRATAPSASPVSGPWPRVTVGTGDRPSLPVRQQTGCHRPGAGHRAARDRQLACRSGRRAAGYGAMRRGNADPALRQRAEPERSRPHAVARGRVRENHRATATQAATAPRPRAHFSAVDPTGRYHRPSTSTTPSKTICICSKTTTPTRSAATTTSSARHTTHRPTEPQTAAISTQTTSRSDLRSRRRDCAKAKPTCTTSDHCRS